MGVFDVAEDPTYSAKTKAIDDQLPLGMGFHQMSTIPIVRKLKEPKRTKKHKPFIKDLSNPEASDSSSSSESESEDIFMEFDSSEDEAIDLQSRTTKSIVKPTKNPLIQEVSSIQYDKASSTEETKDENCSASERQRQKLKAGNSKRRSRL